MDIEEDAKAGEGKTNGEEHEGEGVAEPGADKADYDTEEPGGGEWGDGVELGLDSAVFEAFHYAGKEVGYAVAHAIAAWFCWF